MDRCNYCNTCNQGCSDFLVKIIFHVKDIKCENCEIKIKKKLRVLKGVEHIDVDLNVGEIKVFYDDRIVDYLQLKEVIQNAGFNIDEKN